MNGQPINLICFRAVIVVSTFVIMPLVDSSLVLLQCTEVEGKMVLFHVPQVQCFSSEHAPAAAVAIIVITLMLFVLPAFLSLVLCRLWKSDMISYSRDLPPIQTLFQCLYLIFKPEMFFMMPITILEKGILAILFTVLHHYSNQIQTNVYIMVLTLVCATRIYWQPFSNHLEAYLNREVALGVLAMVALRMYTDHYGVSNVALVEMGVLIFLPPILHCIRWLQHNYIKHKETILEVVHKGSSLVDSMKGKLSNKVETNSKLSESPEGNKVGNGTEVLRIARSSSLCEIESKHRSQNLMRRNSITVSRQMIKKASIKDLGSSPKEEC
ncbi:hypothetical protein BCR33DRAFT_843856 [Rhizoclosmatium globosum]|uniref:TRP C-terminal domain-containing protein n=1 Tax=Rhizoclosmatium globosum TaxID=329046 RepID=A0A1Y2B0I6_9FUNG|nr:hypothetical protein BCR33DRAFT_843856 [Rhizoclosmatium globosum]|eukprot:ORY28246.1 hypothetical protein BCR33DRAFT_843856 [Rhizoclosmatium globosum]